MTSSADRPRRAAAAFAAAALLAAVLAATAAGSPPAGPAAADGVPAALAGRVRALVAAKWALAPAEIEIEWGTAPPGLDAEAAVELAGRGADGWFHAVCGEGAGRSALRLRAGVRETVRVSVRPLAAGERLAAQDVRDTLRLRWGPPRPAEATPQEGWEVRRPVAAGETLAWPAVAPPPVIAAGEPVEMVWRRGPVRVSLEGVAAHAARRGENVRIRVGNRPGSRTGIALAPGLVGLATGERR
jgi:flagella basal body P-ring formation protein FlgA